MPTSKKRVKKDYEEAVRITKNPLKTKLGKFMVIMLILGFVLSGVVGLIYILYQTMSLS